MRVVIVDDEPLALERLAFGLRDLEGIEVVGQARDGIEAAEMIAALSPDLAILDIQMPGLTGLSVAAGLAAGDQRPEIVFVTAYEQFAADAFEVEATDYLIKPVRFDRLRQAVLRSRRRIAERKAMLEFASGRPPGDVPGPREAIGGASIFVPDPRGNRVVPIALIDWIEAAKDYVLLHTSTRSHMVRMTMAELERRLDPRTMLRVHRSAFVRRDAIRAVERPGRGAIVLRLDDQVAIQVGPSYLRAVDATLKASATWRPAGRT